MMRYWTEIDEAGKVLRTIVLNNKSPLDDFKWIVKNLGGTWKLEKKEPETHRMESKDAS